MDKELGGFFLEGDPSEMLSEWNLENFHTMQGNGMGMGGMNNMWMNNMGGAQQGMVGGMQLGMNNMGSMQQGMMGGAAGNSPGMGGRVWGVGMRNMGNSMPYIQGHSGMGIGINPMQGNIRTQNMQSMQNMLNMQNMHNMQGSGMGM